MFSTYIHSTVFIGENVHIENASMVPYCILTTDIKIGKAVFINSNTTIGHDVKIGDFTVVNGKVEITGEKCNWRQLLFWSRFTYNTKTEN